MFVWTRVSQTHTHTQTEREMKERFRFQIDFAANSSINFESNQLCDQQY